MPDGSNIIFGLLILNGLALGYPPPHISNRKLEEKHLPETLNAQTNFHMYISLGNNVTPQQEERQQRAEKDKILLIAKEKKAPTIAVCQYPQAAISAKLTLFSFPALKC